MSQRYDNNLKTKEDVLSKYEVKNADLEHKKGLAADISVRDSRSRYIVLNSLLLVGFKRFGIADTFIHVDLDTERKQNIIWTY